MTRFLGRYSRALGVAAATLALALPTTASAAGAHQRVDADGPNYQKPTVGECRSYTYAERKLDSDSADPVDCDARHTALVVTVATLPSGGSWDFAGKDLTNIIVKKCLPSGRQALGRSAKVVDMSAYNMSIFIPTPTQRAHGARWVRCDLVRLGGAQLLPLADKADLLDGRRIGSTEARCLVRADRLIRTTACSQKHVYRAKQVLTMPFKRYPSTDKALKFASKKCKVAKRGKPWYATWQDPIIFKGGNHQLVCYSRTSK